MQTKLITLDSSYGFAIYMTEPGMAAHPNIRNRGRILTDKNNNPYLFSNSRIAFLVADIEFELNKGEFKLKVIKFDNRKNKITIICNFESMQMMSNSTYQAISKNMIYYIKEQRIEMVKSIRYFIFEDGETIRTEQAYGRKRNKYLLKLIARAATEYMYSIGTIAGVRKISVDELEIRFKNSSARIHIMTNGLISNINKTRKESGKTPQYQRCIPYDFKLDKYVTIFSFVTKETAESEGFGFDGEIDLDIERTYDYIRGYIKNLSRQDPKLEGFHYLPIDFNGTILVKE